MKRNGRSMWTSRGGPRSRITAALLILAGCLTTLACAPTLLSEGRRARKEGNDAEAVRLLQLAIAQKPEDGVRHRELGIACFGLQDFECAVEHLGIADQQGELNGEALYCLGSAQEELGATDTALATYSRYWEVGRLSSYRRKMVRRVRELVHERVISDVDTVGDRIPENTLAVLRLGTISESKELMPIGSGLTEWVMTDLQSVRSLNVLERLRIDAVLEELEFAQSGIVQPGSVPRIGRMLGARRVVVGTVLDQGGERIRVDLLVRDALGKEPEISVTAEGRVSDFFSLEKELVFDLLDQMGISLTAWEREKIERIPTRSLAAFLAYSKAVEHEWAGKDDQAEDLFRQTVEIDPMFDETMPVVESDEESRAEETVDNVTGDLWPEDPEEAPTDPIESQEAIPDPPPPPDMNGIPGPPPPLAGSRGSGGAR